jgi:DNA-binding PadR family transcriptional regulator
MLSLLEYHVLLALSAEPMYGYAISEAVATESGGGLEPRAGSLYRVIARLMSAGLVREAEPPAGTAPHPGLARRYYALTSSGRRALSAEARRLEASAVLARKRLGLAKGSP